METAHRERERERNEKQLQMVSALHVLLWVSRPQRRCARGRGAESGPRYVGHVDYVIC